MLMIRVAAVVYQMKEINLQLLVAVSPKCMLLIEEFGEVLPSFCFRAIAYWVDYEAPVSIIFNK